MSSNEVLNENEFEGEDEEIVFVEDNNEEEEEEEVPIAKQVVIEKKKEPRSRVQTQPTTSKQFFRARGKNPKLYTFTAEGDLQVPALDKQPATVLQLPYYRDATPVELEAFDEERKAKLSTIETQFDAKMTELRQAIVDWRVTNRSSTVLELQSKLRILDAQRTSLRSPYRWTKMYKNPVTRNILFENRYAVRRLGYDVYAYKPQNFPSEILRKATSERPEKVSVVESISRVARPLRAGEQPPLYIFKADDPTTSNLSPYALLSFDYASSRYPSIAHAYEAQRLKEFGKSNIYDRILSKVKDPFAMRKKAVGGVVGAPSDPMALLLLIVRAASRRKVFAEALRATGSAPLIFAEPQDIVLGVGLGADDLNIEDPSKWTGENLYGQALMTVRKEIPEGELVDIVLNGGSVEEKIDIETDATIAQAKERKNYFIGLQKRKAHFSN